MSAEEEFKVFYAWQDDLPNKTNRSFIEKAAQDAIKRIAKKAELEKSKRPTFDKDTKGTKGAADIVATILSKIEACDLFIADVTSVCRYYTKGKEKNRRKESSNPNVLFELGYAFGTVGWEKTCLVLNTHYAKAETLPFDLRGRTLCTYDADPNNTSELAENRRQLSKELEEIILGAMESRGLGNPQAEPDREWIRNVIDAFIDDLRTGRFRMGTRNNLFSLLLMPSRMPEASLDLGHIDRLLKDKLRPISSGGWNFEYDVHHFGIISSSDKEITDNTEFRDDQVIRAANSRILIGHDAPRLLPGGEEAKVLWIPGEAFGT